jgi:hypothetical protein
VQILSLIPDVKRAAIVKNSEAAICEAAEWGDRSAKKTATFSAKAGIFRLLTA